MKNLTIEELEKKVDDLLKKATALQAVSTVRINALPVGSTTFTAKAKIPYEDEDDALNTTKHLVPNDFIKNLSWKQPVRAATTIPGVLSTFFESGDVIDGVTLATGDRILIKNQSTATENGIYTVNATGAPTRANDLLAGTSAAGAVVYVIEGVENGTISFDQTNVSATVDSNDLKFDKLIVDSSWKEPVELTSTVNIDLGSTNDPNPIDGFTLGNNQRILLKDQTDAKENGIYIAVIGNDPDTWIRALDMAATSNVQGAIIYTVKGTLNGKNAFVQISISAIVDTNDLEFSVFPVIDQVSNDNPLICGWENTQVIRGNVLRFPLVGIDTGNGTDTDVEQIVPVAMTIRNPVVFINENTATGGTATIKIRKNGQDTGMTITIAFGQVGKVFGSGTVIFEAGDRVSVEADQTALTGTAVQGIKYQGFACTSDIIAPAALTLDISTWGVTDEDSPITGGLLYTTEGALEDTPLTAFELSLKNAPTGSPITVDVLQESDVNSNDFTNGSVFSTKPVIAVGDFVTSITSGISSDTWFKQRRLQIVIVTNDSDLVASGLKVTLK